MAPLLETLKRGPLEELTFNFAPQLLISAAIDLEVFPAIAAGTRDVSGIARATAASERGIRIVLDCMAALSLLQERAGTYELNDYARKYFLPSSEDYVGAVFASCDQLLRLWLSLPEAIRTGKPTVGILTEEERMKLNLDTVEALFRIHKRCAWKLAGVLEKKLDVSGGNRKRLKILDLAAGSAVWSIPLALRAKNVAVTAIDYLPVLEVARRHTREFGIESQYRFIAADIRKMTFEQPEYDWALLGHICHSEGPYWSQRLIQNCFRVLRKNGRLLIMEYFRDEKNNSDMIPLMLAVNALLGTSDGDTFSFSQYKKWLLEAGFSKPSRIRLGGRSRVISGVKI